MPTVQGRTIKRTSRKTANKAFRKAFKKRLHTLWKKKGPVLFLSVLIFGFLIGFLLGGYLQRFGRTAQTPSIATSSILDLPKSQKLSPVPLGLISPPSPKREAPIPESTPSRIKGSQERTLPSPWPEPETTTSAEPIPDSLPSKEYSPPPQNRLSEPVPVLVLPAIPSIREESSSPSIEPQPTSKSIEGRLPIDGFIHVQGGEYLIGNPFGFKYEKPVRSVKVSDFYISPKEVTRKEWRQVMGTLPMEGVMHREARKSLFEASLSTEEDLEVAVDFITWFEAVSFCNTLSRRIGLEPVYRIEGNRVFWNRNASGYRLPTEEEWEYAAREGKQTRGFRFSGAQKPEIVARFNLPPEAGPGVPGTLEPNALGIYDMSGNVAEWCWNVFLPYNSESFGKDLDDPTLPRSVRGGTWMSDAGSVTVSARMGLPPHTRQRGVGIRLVRNR